VDPGHVPLYEVNSYYGGVGQAGEESTGHSTSLAQSNNSADAKIGVPTERLSAIAQHHLKWGTHSELVPSGKRRETFWGEKSVGGQHGPDENIGKPSSEVRWPSSTGTGGLCKDGERTHPTAIKEHAEGRSGCSCTRELPRF